MSSKIEKMYSPRECASLLGISLRKVHQLIQLGQRDVMRGAVRNSRGLYPTFKFSHKCRRIPESAIIALQNRCAPAVAQFASA